jgi:SAM-dependent methyltransferase
LDFEIENDKSIGLLTQKYSLETDKYLKEAYKLGSVIGGNTLEDEIGDNYTNGVLEYMDSVLQWEDYAGKKFLEIGCGIGYLLSKIKNKKGEVLGVEPGKQGQVGSKRFDFPVIQGFYPEVEINGKFDVIISYCVLEHVSNPLSFLKELKPLLNPRGKIFAIVPNEKPYIKSGDISSLFHEHWSYFTEESLRNLIEKSLGTNIDIECSKYGGLLFSNFSFDEDSTALDEDFDVDNSYFTKFMVDFEGNAERLVNFFTENKVMGVYVPLRIVNYLINYEMNVENIRFFDDDNYSYRKYFPGIDVKIENFEDLVKNPPQKILVMSNFFGELIKDKIQTVFNKDIEIVLWSDIFNSDY